MTEIALILPNQLFEEHPALISGRKVIIAEEFLFFRVQKFHKQKIVLLRASMKAYADFLTKKGFDVTYIDSTALLNRGQLFTWLAKEGVSALHLADPVDDWLEQDLDEATKKNKWDVTVYNSPMFLCSKEELKSFFKGKTKYSMAQFYAYQRKKFDILMDGSSPVGGKFSFDAENRKKIPKGVVVPELYHPHKNAFLDEAIEYVENTFPEAIGNVHSFTYAITFTEAKSALDDFIQNRLMLFGDYEDAIKQGSPTLFHSVLSPLLNIGLLTPEYVLSKVLKARNVPLNSLEGFIRQIVGWREFMRACYILRGRAQRSTNYFNHNNPLPKGFWDATTGVQPIDATIAAILDTGYCHHIERLMVLGSFLLLTECHPDAIYEWFMGYFVDSYDWVMVPNVYAMSQYAEGGGVTTKPYISGANYILKMSDYKKGDWVELWDGLFWRFMAKHKKLFEVNPRTNMLLGQLTSNKEVLDAKITKANTWLSANV
ncbi:MAG: cryptochrome/photolyase family protein [Chlamydiales bacterium]|nr:cryptochrome/photolyase family protein [Chlamydiales bacterium]